MNLLCASGAAEGLGILVMPDNWRKGCRFMYVLMSEVLKSLWKLEGAEETSKWEVKEGLWDEAPHSCTLMTEGRFLSAKMTEVENPRLKNGLGEVKSLEVPKLSVGSGASL